MHLYRVVLLSSDLQKKPGLGNTHQRLTVKSGNKYIIGTMLKKFKDLYNEIHKIGYSVT